MKNYIIILMLGFITITSIARADEGTGYSPFSYATEDQEALVVSTLDMKELRSNLNKAKRQIKLIAVNEAIKNVDEFNN